MGALLELPAPVWLVGALLLEPPAPVRPEEAEPAPVLAPVLFVGAQLVRLMLCMMPRRGCVDLVGAHVRALRDVPAPVWPVPAQAEPSPCMMPSRGCVDLAGAQADADCV